MESIEKNQLLNDYINGVLDLETSTKLESNLSFMESVFMLTRNKKYYEFCANSLKNDYNFLIFLSKLFYDDSDFMLNICSHYLFYDINHDDKYFKVLTIAQKYFNNPVTEENSVYYMRCRTRASEFMSSYNNHIKAVRDNYSTEKEKSRSIGFNVALTEFRDSDSLDFIASNFMYKIFTTYNFEEYLHMACKSKEELLMLDKKIIILDFVNKIDEDLAKYITNKPDLFFEGSIRIDLAINRFDNYEEVDSQTLVDKFNCELNNFLVLNGIEYTYQIDMVKMEEIKKKRLDEEFYGSKINMVSFLKTSDDDPIIYVTRKFIKDKLDEIFKVKLLKKVI